MKHKKKFSFFCPLFLALCFFAAHAVAADFNELYQQGRTALEDGKLQTALFYLEQAAVQKNDHAEALQDLGYCYAKLNRLEEAFRVLEKASQIAPDNTKIKQDFGALLVKMKQWKNALKIFDEILLKTPDMAMAHFNRGLIYMALQKTNLAQAEYEILLRIDPKLAKDLFQFIYL